MANETEFEALLDQVKSGSPFEALRAAEQLAKLERRRRKTVDELLRDAVQSTAEAFRQNKDINVEEIVFNVQQKARRERSVPVDGETAAVK